MGDPGVGVRYGWMSMCEVGGMRGIGGGWLAMVVKGPEDNWCETVWGWKRRRWWAAEVAAAEWR